MDTFRLSETQVQQYLHKINFYNGELTEPQHELPSATLNNLNRLMRLHIQSIPYGNLSFHYYHTVTSATTNSPTNPADINSTQGVSLHIGDIFTKLVLKNRDGYCFEHNLLFYHILLALNYKVYKTLANCVNRALYGEQGRKVKVDGIEHLALILTLNEDTKYLVDVGYVGTSSFLAIPINFKTKVDDDCPQVELSDSSKLQIVRRYPPDNESDLYEPWFMVRSYTLAEKFSKYKSDFKYEHQPLFYFKLAPCTWKDVNQLNLLLVLQKTNMFYQHLFLKKTVAKSPFHDELDSSGTLSLFDNQVKFVLDKLADNDELSVTKVYLNDNRARLDAYRKWFNIAFDDKDVEHIPETYIYKS